LKNFNKDQINQLLTQSRTILITSHHNPDGDAIGSIFALALVLRKMGKNAIPMVPNDYPEFLKWIPGNDQVVIFEADSRNAAEAIHSADLIFCLDYNALHRTGKMQEPLRSTSAAKVLIDHHLEPVLEDFN
jgi:phosphoesterase RecJ-like protein